MMRTAISLFLVLFSLFQESKAQDIERTDHYVKSDSDVSLFVREVVNNDFLSDSKPAVLMLHGARVPGIASFDLDVPNGSLAADLAKAGHAVYIMDARGYGYSTRPPEMSHPPENNTPLVRSPEVVRDVAAVVDWISENNRRDPVALLGWATGGHWLGYYATVFPEHVSHLILYNTMYGGAGGHPTLGAGSGLEDPDQPGRFNTQEYGTYRFSTAGSLFGAWDNSIPVEDKSSWRAPAVKKAYAETALASDETSEDRDPASFRAPSGALKDSYLLALGRQLWDASLIQAPVLIIRSENDFWSRPEDVEALKKHLIQSPEVETVLLPEATHFVHLDRPERGRDQFLEEIQLFLTPE